MGGAGDFDAHPDLVDRDGIVVVTDTPYARAALHRALALLEIVVRSIAVGQEHDLWGYPAIRVDGGQCLVEPNEAWMATPQRGPFFAREGGSHRQLLEQNRASSDPRVARVATVIERQVELVQAGARPHALIGYEGVSEEGFVATFVCRHTETGLWLSHVPLHPFLRLSSTRESRLRATLEAALEEVYWFAPVLDRHGRLADFVFLDANERAVDEMKLPWERLVGRCLTGLFPAYRKEGIFDRYRDAFIHHRELESHEELPRGAGVVVCLQRVRRIEDELVVFNAPVGAAEDVEPSVSRTPPRRDASSSGFSDSKEIEKR